MHGRLQSNTPEHKAVDENFLFLDLLEKKIPASKHLYLECYKRSFQISSVLNFHSNMFQIIKKKILDKDDPNKYKIQLLNYLIY